MSFLDSHCHLQDPRVDPYRADWIARARARGLTRFCLGGVSPEDWKRQEELFEGAPSTYHLTAGLHPGWVSDPANGGNLEAAAALLREKLTTDPRYVALGETGLDHRDRFTAEMRALQAHWFRAQRAIARDCSKPVILHVVRAHGEVLETLRAGPPSIGLRGAGLVHSFGGAPEVAREYLRHGFLLSISAAVVTRGEGKAFRQLRDSVLETGLSDLALETDAPDQPPADRRGEPNSVENLFRVAEIIGGWKGERPETVLAASTENWDRVFSKR